MELKFLGKILGTYSGWDGDQEYLMFYDFIPNELGRKFINIEETLPEGCTLNIQVVEGVVDITHNAEAKALVISPNWSVFMSQVETEEK